MNRHERAYRRLLALYPATFRSDYADEMARLFSDQLLEATTAHGRWAVAGLWLRTTADLIATAPGTHIHKEAPVTQPVDLPPSGTLSSQAPALDQSVRVLIGLLPLWILLFFVLAAPAFTEPLFNTPPTVLGAPAGLVVIGVALALMLLGIQIMRRGSDALAVAAFALCTVPSIVLIVFGPAAMLMVLNLAL
jgi:hypothetical protein